MAILEGMQNYTSKITFNQNKAKLNSKEQEAERIKNWSKEVVQGLKNLNLAEEFMPTKYATN